jgi:uncharacterized membrane protein YgcG
MFTGTTSHSGALISAIAVLTGAAILRGGAAAADSNQDDQFLALLDKEGIPAVQGVPSLIDTAHRVCRTLDAGMPADALVDAMVNDAYGIDPTERQYPPDRLARTEARFIIAAVEAYCPYDHGKLASTMANPTPGSNELAHPIAAYTRNAVNSGSDVIRAVPSGENTPNPQIPPPPPPTVQVLTPPLPIAAPTRPKRPPPPPQQPPRQAEPPPQQVEPPAVGPEPGGAAGGGGGGSAGGGGNGGGGSGGTGGGGPAEPAPRDPTPGFVRLAP